MSSTSRARDLLAGTGGAVLGGVFRAAGTLRPTAKPLHPRGRLRRGTLVRDGGQPGVGAPLLDEPGTDDVLVRVSRATGLPAWLPDVHGLAVRVPTADGHGDLLLASTGWGPVSRYVLTGSRDPGGRPLTTLLPYRTAGGLVLLGARFLDEDTVELAYAVGAGAFRTFGRIELGEELDDPVIAFDPVRQQLPGLEVPGWVVRLREPAYAGARGTRDHGTDPAAGPHA